MVGIDDAIKQGTKEGIEESIEQGVKQSAKQLIEESMTTATKSTLESTFGRQFGHYLDATGERDQVLSRELYHSVRRMIREGGENDPKRLRSTVKALGSPRPKPPDSGRTGSHVTRRGADEAVQLALKASGRSLKEIIATSSVIGDRIRLRQRVVCKNPKQALRRGQGSRSPSLSSEPLSSRASQPPVPSSSVPATRSTTSSDMGSAHPTRRRNRPRPNPRNHQHTQ